MKLYFEARVSKAQKDACAVASDIKALLREVNKKSNGVVSGTVDTLQISSDRYSYRIDFDSYCSGSAKASFKRALKRKYGDKYHITDEHLGQIEMHLIPDNI